MSAEELQAKVTIINDLGLHARAATLFVQTSSKFPCDVFVEKAGQRVNGKSIMGVLMLVASKGTEISIITKGERAKEASEALVALVNDRFGEES
jgi:phosphocarrier protein